MYKVLHALWWKRGFYCESPCDSVRTEKMGGILATAGPFSTSPYSAHLKASIHWGLFNLQATRGTLVLNAPINGDSLKLSLSVCHSYVSIILFSSKQIKIQQSKYAFLFFERILYFLNMERCRTCPEGLRTLIWWGTRTSLHSLGALVRWNDGGWGGWTTSWSVGWWSLWTNPETREKTCLFLGKALLGHLRGSGKGSPLEEGGKDGGKRED